VEASATTVGWNRESHDHFLAKWICEYSLQEKDSNLVDKEMALENRRYLDTAGHTYSY